MEGVERKTYHGSSEGIDLDYFVTKNEDDSSKMWNGLYNMSFNCTKAESWTSNLAIAADVSGESWRNKNVTYIVVIQELALTSTMTLLFITDII